MGSAAETPRPLASWTSGIAHVWQAQGTKTKLLDGEHGGYAVPAGKLLGPRRDAVRRRDGSHVVGRGRPTTSSRRSRPTPLTPDDPGELLPGAGQLCKST